MKKLRLKGFQKCSQGRKTSKWHNQKVDSPPGQHQEHLGDPWDERDVWATETQRRMERCLCIDFLKKKQEGKDKRRIKQGWHSFIQHTSTELPTTHHARHGDAVVCKHTRGWSLYGAYDLFWLSRTLFCYLQLCGPGCWREGCEQDRHSPYIQGTWSLHGKADIEQYKRIMSNYGLEKLSNSPEDISLRRDGAEMNADCWLLHRLLCELFLPELHC